MVHRPTGQQLRYGALAETAATMPTPSVKPREKDFKVIGQPTPRVDSMLKVTGQAGFGLDVQVPGAKVAVLLRSPVPGGTLVSFDDSEAKKLAGVSRWWRCREAWRWWATPTSTPGARAQAVKVEWNDGALANFDSKAFREEHVAALRGAGGKRVKNVGDARGRARAPPPRWSRPSTSARTSPTPHGAAERHRLGARREVRDLGAHPGAR